MNECEREGAAFPLRRIPAPWPCSESAVLGESRRLEAESQTLSRSSAEVSGRDGGLGERREV